MRPANPASLALALPLALPLALSAAGAGAATPIPAHTLDNGVIHVVMTDAIGGRLTAFSLAGQPNFLKFDPGAGDPAAPVNGETPNIPYLGHEIWLGPQSQWWTRQSVNPALAQAKAPWPPEPFLSVAPYVLVRASKHEIVLRSAASPVSGIALTKRFALVPGKPNSLQVEVSAVNGRSSPVSRDIWFNTRTHADTRVYVPVNPAVPLRTQQIPGMHSAALKTVVKDGVFSLDMEDTPGKPSTDAPARHGKVFIQPSHGWMAGFHGAQAFIVQFALQPREAIRPEQGQVEIFNDVQPADPARGLMEMEVHLAFLRAQARTLGLKGL